MQNNDPQIMAFFRVSHAGGLKVRKKPSLHSEVTGEVIDCGEIIACNQWVQDAENWFVHIFDTEGWVIAQSGALRTLERVEGPTRISGEWFYEVIHPSGMKFAKLPDIQSERNDAIHPMGTILRAVEKMTEAESTLTVVRLENFQGWLFENIETGEVLDRLDDDEVMRLLDPNHPKVLAAFGTERDRERERDREGYSKSHGGGAEALPPASRAGSGYHSGNVTGERDREGYSRHLGNAERAHVAGSPFSEWSTHPKAQLKAGGPMSGGTGGGGWGGDKEYGRGGGGGGGMDYEQRDRGGSGGYGRPGAGGPVDRDMYGSGVPGRPGGGGGAEWEHPYHHRPGPGAAGSGDRGGVGGYARPVAAPNSGGYHPSEGDGQPQPPMYAGGGRDPYYRGYLGGGAGAVADGSKGHNGGGGGGGYPRGAGAGAGGEQEYPLDRGLPLTRKDVKTEDGSGTMPVSVSADTEESTGELTGTGSGKRTSISATSHEDKSTGSAPGDCRKASAPWTGLPLTAENLASLPRQLPNQMQILEDKGPVPPPPSATQTQTQSMTSFSSNLSANAAPFHYPAIAPLSGSGAPVAVAVAGSLSLAPTPAVSQSHMSVSGVSGGLSRNGKPGSAGIGGAGGIVTTLQTTTGAGVPPSSSMPLASPIPSTILQRPLSTMNPIHAPGSGLPLVPLAVPLSSTAPPPFQGTSHSHGASLPPPVPHLSDTKSMSILPTTGNPAFPSGSTGVANSSSSAAAATNLSLHSQRPPPFLLPPVEQRLSKNFWGIVTSSIPLPVFTFPEPNSGSGAGETPSAVRTGSTGSGSSSSSSGVASGGSYAIISSVLYPNTVTRFSAKCLGSFNIPTGTTATPSPSASYSGGNSSGTGSAAITSPLLTSIEAAPTSTPATPVATPAGLSVTNTSGNNSNEDIGSDEPAIISTSTSAVDVTDASPPSESSVPATEVMAVTETVEPNRSVAQEASSSSGGGGRGSQSGLPTSTVPSHEQTLDSASATAAAAASEEGSRMEVVDAATEGYEGRHSEEEEVSEKKKARLNEFPIAYVPSDPLGRIAESEAVRTAIESFKKVDNLKEDSPMIITSSASPVTVSVEGEGEGEVDLPIEAIRQAPGPEPEPEKSQLMEVASERNSDSDSNTTAAAADLSSAETAASANTGAGTSMAVGKEPGGGGGEGGGSTPEAAEEAAVDKIAGGDKGTPASAATVAVVATASATSDTGEAEAETGKQLTVTKRTLFQVKECGGWVLSESIDDSSCLIRPLEETPCEEWYRIIYKGGITLRGKPDMSDRLDIALPMGCWVKVSLKVRVPGQDTTFLKLEGCVGARPSVTEGWIFDRAAGNTAAQLTREPSVLRCSGLMVMVLYPGGIKLRVNPSIDATLLGTVARAYEVQLAEGIVTTSDLSESYALLPGGAWLPCKGPFGQEVARKVTEMTEVSVGVFEVHLNKSHFDADQFQKVLQRSFFRFPCLDEPPCPAPTSTLNITNTPGAVIFICNFCVRHLHSGIRFFRIANLGATPESAAGTSFWTKDLSDGSVAVKLLTDSSGAIHSGNINGHNNNTSLNA